MVIVVLDLMDPIGPNGGPACSSQTPLLALNQVNLLRSAAGMAHVLRSGLVMSYTTSSTLALKPSVSPPYYPWVTATKSTHLQYLSISRPKPCDGKLNFVLLGH